jgi:hypothetical protein
MKVYEWTITVSGCGNTEEEAWADCEEGLIMEGLGTCDMDGKVVEDDGEGADCED